MSLPDRTAPTDSPVMEIIAQRWSPRIFDAAAGIDESALASALEAARWAPSAYNLQPWRVAVARRGTDEHGRVAEALIDFNKMWAPHASALVVFVAATQAPDGSALTHGQYDTGQAAAYFSLQAQASGLYTHQMSGFDPQVLTTALGLPDGMVPQAVIAVGVLGDFNAAPEMIQENESAPRERRSVAESTLFNV